MNEPLVYFILTHPHLPGVGLSKRMNWTSERFEDDAEAAEFAHEDAAGRPYRIERKRVTKDLLRVERP